MTITITMDRAGRIVLPKPVRNDLQLAPGDSLTLESHEDQIIMRPVRGTMPLRKKQGIWVFRVGEPLSAAAVNQTVQEVRQEREHSNLGHNRARTRYSKGKTQ